MKEREAGSQAVLTRNKALGKTASVVGAETGQNVGNR